MGSRSEVGALCGLNRRASPSPLFCICDDVVLPKSNPLAVSLLGPGSCLLNADPSILTDGLKGRGPTRAQLYQIFVTACEMARKSPLLHELPMLCEGAPRLDVLAALFVFTTEEPYPIYRFVTDIFSHATEHGLYTNHRAFLKLILIAQRAVPRSHGHPYRHNGSIFFGCSPNPSCPSAASASLFLDIGVGESAWLAAPVFCSSRADDVRRNHPEGLCVEILNAGALKLLPGVLSSFSEEVYLPEFPLNVQVISQDLTAFGWNVKAEVVAQSEHYLSYLSSKSLPADDEDEVATHFRCKKYFTVNTSSSNYAAALSSSAAASGSARHTACPTLSALKSCDIAAIVASFEIDKSGSHHSLLNFSAVDGCMLCSCPSDELGEIFKEMGMSAQDRRFLLMSIKEWKDKPAELAFMLSEGIAFRERSPALVASYEQAVRMGHAESHASLAWLLMVQPLHIPSLAVIHSTLTLPLQHDVIGITKDVSRAYSLAYAGAQAGCHHCKGALACCLAHGWGTSRDIDQALQLTIASSEQSSKFGNYMLGFFISGLGNIDEAQSIKYGMKAKRETKLDAFYLSAACDQGLVEGRNELAYHLQHKEASRDRERAFQLYSEAASFGHPGANESVGYFLMRGVGTTMDKVAAARYLNIAAEAGCLGALRLLLELGDPSRDVSTDMGGSLFLEGLMHMSSHRHGLAVCFFERAIRPPLQHAESHAMLSWMLQHGRDGVPIQHELAHNLARQGAVLGCEHSQGAVAHCLLNGWGVAKSVAAALKLAKESAAKGSYMGQYVLAAASIQVYVPSVHNNEATLLGVLQNLKLASDQGLPEARFGYAIALITFFTDTKHKDTVQKGKVYKQAKRLYELAAFGGVIAAQESLEPLDEIDRRIHLAADFKALADLMRASVLANSWSQTLSSVISKIALQTLAGVSHFKPAKPVIAAASNSIAVKFTSQGRFLSSLALASSDSSEAEGRQKAALRSELLGLTAQSAGHANVEVDHQGSREQSGAAIPAIISRLGKLLGSQYCPECKLDATIGSKCTVSGDYHMKMR